MEIRCALAARREAGFDTWLYRVALWPLLRSAWHRACRPLIDLLGGPRRSWTGPGSRIWAAPGSAPYRGRSEALQALAPRQGRRYPVLVSLSGVEQYRRGGHHGSERRGVGEPVVARPARFESRPGRCGRRCRPSGDRRGDSRAGSEQLSLAFGGEIDRWPANEREAARRLLIAQPALTAPLIDQARCLDRTLDDGPSVQPESELRSAAIVSSRAQAARHWPRSGAGWLD